jgi:YggT family protein
MVLLENFTYAVATVLDQLLWLYLWIVIISALLSWVNPDPRNPIVRFLHAVTEPLFFQIRRRLPFVFIGGFDLSPLVVMFGILFLRTFVVRSLYEFAQRLSAAPPASLFS